MAFTVRGAPTKNAKDPLTKGQGFETVPGLPGMGLGAHKGSALERCNTLHAITPAYHTLATALFPAHPLLGGSGTRGVTSHSPHKPRRPPPRNAHCWACRLGGAEGAHRLYAQPCPRHRPAHCWV